MEIVIMKTHDELKLVLAKAFYNQSFTLPNWDLEQDHVKFSYFERAENLLTVIDDLGMELRDKPEMVITPEMGIKAEEPPELQLTTPDLKPDLNVEAKRTVAGEDSQQEEQSTEAPKRRRRRHQGDL